MNYNCVCVGRESELGLERERESVEFVHILHVNYSYINI